MTGTDANGIVGTMKDATRTFLAAFLLAVPSLLQAGFLGVGDLEPVTAKTAPDAGLAAGEAGIRIGQVIPGSPAEKAGLLAGDILTEVDGATASAPEKLVQKIGKTPAGAEVVIRYLRGGKPLEARAVLANPPPPGARPKAGIEGQKAPTWSAAEWKNLPEGKTSLDVSDYAGKVVYLYFFQSW